MKKMFRRVCSHMEPPPPEGNGKKYAVCSTCAVPFRNRRANTFSHTYAVYDSTLMAYIHHDGNHVALDSKLTFKTEIPAGEKRWREALFNHFRKEFRKVRIAERDMIGRRWNRWTVAISA